MYFCNNWNFVAQKLFQVSWRCRMDVALIIWNCCKECPSCTIHDVCIFMACGRKAAWVIRHMTIGHILHEDRCLTHHKKSTSCLYMNENSCSHSSFINLPCHRLLFISTYTRTFVLLGFTIPKTISLKSVEAKLSVVFYNQKFQLHVRKSQFLCRDTQFRNPPFPVCW